MIDCMNKMPSAHAMLVGCGVLSGVACGVAAMIAVLGFEAMDDTQLLGLTLLTLLSPAAVLIHVLATKQLTSDDKHLWLRAFVSSRLPAAFSTYLTSTDLAADTRKLQQMRESSSSTDDVPAR